MLAVDFDLKEALNKSGELAKKLPEHEDTFGTYSGIYTAPTSNVKDMVSFYGKKDSALTVGAMGAIPFELALNGTRVIDCFDKNVLQFLYYALVEAGIRNLDYLDFIHTFTSKNITSTRHDMSLFLNSYALSEIFSSVPEEVLKYWICLLKNNSIVSLYSTGLFRPFYFMDLPYLEKYSSIYTPDGFYELQNLLNRGAVQINYHICDISDIDREFDGKTYDLIMFDNILQYYRQNRALSSVYDVNQYITKKIDPMLNKDGQIQVAYGFQIVSSAVKYMKDGQAESNFIKRAIVNEEIKKGIIPGLLKKYDYYQYDFIPGVETTDKEQVENVLLTYRKRIK